MAGRDLAATLRIGEVRTMADSISLSFQRRWTGADNGLRGGTMCVGARNNTSIPLNVAYIPNENVRDCCVPFCCVSVGDPFGALCSTPSLLVAEVSRSLLAYMLFITTVL
jgi:hypothetical protein